jgi:hypothetical protein
VAIEDGSLGAGNDVPESHRNSDCIFVDNEGLLKAVDWFFAVKRYRQPIVGCGGVLGTEKHGEAVPARTTLEELRPVILTICRRRVPTNRSEYATA